MKPLTTDYLKRFNSYTAPGPNGCILWAAGTNSYGYGSFRHGQKCVRVHRWIWEQLKGPIPPGATIHHRCFERLCVNIDHLEIMSHSDNARLKGRHCPSCTCRQSVTNLSLEASAN